jgi:hypothetical protein
LPGAQTLPLSGAQTSTVSAVPIAH